MKFHFGNHHDRGTADNGQLAVMAPVHPSSPLFMDAHHHDDNAAATHDECHQNSDSDLVAAMTTTTEEQCHHDASCSASALVANNNEAVENDPPPPPVHPRVNKSRHFFRIKGRRSRSSSPVSEESSSSTSTAIMPKEMNEQQHNRLNVMDLLRPARMRRSTSLPHPASTTIASSSSTTASTTVTNSNHSSSTSTTTTTTNTNKPKHKRSVTFTCIQIREYNTILGDHPCCESGPPLALGWEYNKNDEVIIGIDDYENTFVDSTDENNGSNNDQNDESMILHRRRSVNELRLNCEDRREILCGLMKPVEDVVETTTATGTTMMEDDSNENQPQLCPLQQELHSTNTWCSVSSSHTTTSEATTASAPTTPLYTKEELRKAERKLERERRGFTGNAARTRRRLKRGFFMPLTPEEEESYKANCCSGGGVVMGNEDDESLDQSSSDDDENGVVGMDISPKKESSTRSL